MNRQVFQKQIIADLFVRKIPFILLSGNLEERVRQVRGILDGFDKYRNPGDRLTMVEPMERYRFH